MQITAFESHSCDYASEYVTAGTLMIHTNCSDITDIQKSKYNSNENDNNTNNNVGLQMFCSCNRCLFILF